MNVRTKTFNGRYQGRPATVVETYRVDGWRVVTRTWLDTGQTEHKIVRGDYLAGTYEEALGWTEGTCEEAS